MNEFKEQLSRTFTERERERNEVSELIISFYERELTQEETEKYLALDTSLIPNNILYTLYCMGKKYIETGKVDEETYIKCMKARKKKISLEEIPEEWQKGSQQEKEDNNNERD